MAQPQSNSIFVSAARLATEIINGDDPSALQPPSQIVRSSPNSPIKLPDFTIKVENFEFHVHRDVLAAQSRWFRTACFGPWIEGQTSTLTFTEESPAAIIRLLQYLYSGLYTDHRFAHPLDAPSLPLVAPQIFTYRPDSLPSSPYFYSGFTAHTSHEIAAEMFVLADKYSIKSLIEYTGGRLVYAMEHETWWFGGMVEILGMERLGLNGEFCHAILHAVARRVVVDRAYGVRRRYCAEVVALVQGDEVLKSCMRERVLLFAEVDGWGGSKVVDEGLRFLLLFQ